MKYNLRKIGRRIANERKNYCHMSQDELLGKLSDTYYISMSRNTLSAIESGKYQHYDVDFLFALCELFNCEIGYLLCEYDYKTREKTDIQKATGLSTTAVDYLCESSFKESIDILNILLKPGNFDNALYHMAKYKEAVSIYYGLIEIRRKRITEITSSDPEKDSYPKVYNYPYNDHLDTEIKKWETKMDVEELRINQYFDFIIQEIQRLAEK